MLMAMLSGLLTFHNIGCMRAEPSRSETAATGKGTSEMCLFVADELCHIQGVKRSNIETFWAIF